MQWLFLNLNAFLASCEQQEEACSRILTRHAFSTSDSSEIERQRRHVKYRKRELNAQANAEHIFSVAEFDVINSGMAPEQAIEKGGCKWLN